MKPLPLLRTLVLIFLAGLTQQAKAAIGIAYPDPPGGWTYAYTGDRADFISNAPNSSLDGTWGRVNGSSEWDGSPLGGTLSTNNYPGGAMVISNGTHASEVGVKYLRFQDPGNPPGYSLATNNGCNGCLIANPANRKILFTHDMTPEGATDTILDDGITISFRARIPTPGKTTGPIDQLYPNAEAANGR